MTSSNPDRCRDLLIATTVAGVADGEVNGPLREAWQLAIRFSGNGSDRRQLQRYCPLRASGFATLVFPPRWRPSVAGGCSLRHYVNVAAAYRLSDMVDA